MAKSGRDSLRSTLAGGHDVVFDYCCDFCEGEGQHKEAVGYCPDCLEYLCAECFDIHLRPKPSRHHRLLDQHQMPKDQQQNRGTKSLSSTLKGGHDYVCEYCCDLCKMEGQKKEAIGYCSTCREYLCAECFSHHTRPKHMRQHVLLDQHQMPQNSQIPIASRQFVKVEVSDVEASVSSLSLKQDIDVRKKIVDRIMNVDASFWGDRSAPYYTGCVVMPGDKLVLVLVDYSNCKVKLALGNIMSQLKLPREIWEITQVNSTQVAVTSPFEQSIYIVNVGLIDLQLDCKVRVNGGCWGIARTSENLVVSYKDPVKVEIINMKGRVLKTVVTEDKGGELFISPYHISVSIDQQTIYISDNNKQSVTSIDLAGKVQATYKDKRLVAQRGITVDTTGMVYVCGCFSNTVFQLTADLTEGRQLLQKSDGIELPISICYCKVTDKLCVGMMNSCSVKVFQMK